MADDFRAKFITVSNHYGVINAAFMTRLNALYDVLKERGLISDDELDKARMKAIEEFYDKLPKKPAKKRQCKKLIDFLFRPIFSLCKGN